LADTPTVHIVLCELEQAMDTLPDHDLDAVADAADAFDFSDWLTGVEDLQEKTPQELWAGLGLNNEQIPGFNEVEDPRGEVNPWDQTKWAKFVKTEQALKFGPRWHQLVGITKMCELIIKGKPLLLMDQVGVGKTLQIVGAIVMYPMLRAYYQRNKRFPPQFSNTKKLAPKRPERDNALPMKSMLYDYEFGIVTIDEGAKMRNPSHHWTTMNELSRLSHCTIAATATSITNSPLVSTFIMLVGRPYSLSFNRTWCTSAGVSGSPPARRKHSWST
ncbi:hypothetical protein LXA43DRAFT_888351, partial [Ganoderma leucocontextum]